MVDEEIKMLSELFGTNVRHIVPYNKQAQGKIENAQRLYQTEIRIMQIKLDNVLEVEYYIKLITMIINCRTPSKEKYSPFKIIFLQRPNFRFKLPTISKSKILRLPEYLKTNMKYH